MNNLKDGDYIAIFEADDGGNIKEEERHKNGEVVTSSVLLWKAHISNCERVIVKLPKGNAVIRVRNIGYVPLQYPIYFLQEDDLVINFNRIKEIQ